MNWDVDKLRNRKTSKPQKRGKITLMGKGLQPLAMGHTIQSILDTNCILHVFFYHIDMTSCINALKGKGEC